MPYIIGIVTRSELEALTACGWEPETPPAKFRQSESRDHKAVQFFVDARMPDIMSGPGWQGPIEGLQDSKEMAGAWWDARNAEDKTGV